MVQPKGRPEERLEYGTCVWATGVGLHPLVGRRSFGGRRPGWVEQCTFVNCLGALGAGVGGQERLPVAGLARGEGGDRAYQYNNPPLPSLNPREAPTLPPRVRFAAQVRALRAKLPAAAQTSPTGLVVDRFLRVKGWDGSIIALGDSAVTNQVRGWILS